MSAALVEAAPLAVPAPPPVGPFVVLPGGVVPRLGDVEKLLAANRHAEALLELEELWPDVVHDLALALRHRLAEAWARMYLGELDRAGDLLRQAELAVRSPHFEGPEQAEVLFRRGCLAFLSGDVAGAVSRFTRALETNERARVPSTSLDARAHEWRARCHLEQHALEAARRDADRALDLAATLGDEQLQARSLVQAALVAERERQWLLARFHSEQALAIFERRDDSLACARVLNNLGGILFLLGDVHGAVARLERSVELAAAAGSDADVAQALSSLAQVQLRDGHALEARDRAASAIASLEGRSDFGYELASAELVHAQALAALGAADSDERFEQAEQTARRFGSAGQLAAALVAHGDARRDAGDVEASAELYRSAAQSLQDVHF